MHEVPLAAVAKQFPAPALVIEGREVQAVLAQLPLVVHTVFVHVAERVPA